MFSNCLLCLFCFFFFVLIDVKMSSTYKTFIEKAMLR